MDLINYWGIKMIDIELELKNVKKLGDGISTSDGKTFDTLTPLFRASYDNGNGNFRLKIDFTGNKDELPKRLIVKGVEEDGKEE